MRLLTFWFLLLGAGIANSTLTMIITFGIPVTPIPPHFDDFSWEECLDACFRLEDCLFATKNATSDCTIYGWSSLTSVTKTDRSSGSYVAFKVDSSEDVCPTAEEAPLLNGRTVNSSVNTTVPPSSSVSNVPYSITFSNGMWSFDPFLCPDGYKYFPRPGGSWCITVANYSTSPNQTTAAEWCAQAAPGGILSGIQTAEEYRYIAGTIQTQIDQRTRCLNMTYQAYWIAGIRKESCMNLPADAAGCDKEVVIEFDDPTWTLPGFFQWYSREPNNGLLIENCLTIRTQSGNRGYNDFPCSWTEKDDECVLGSVCGVKAFLP